MKIGGSRKEPGALDRSQGLAYLGVKWSSWAVEGGFNSATVLVHPWAPEMCVEVDVKTPLAIASGAR